MDGTEVQNVIRNLLPPVATRRIDVYIDDTPIN